MSPWYPGWLTSARRVAAWDQLPRGDTWHSGDGALTTQPGNQVAGTGEVIKRHDPPGPVCSASTWSPELLRPGKGPKHTPNWVCVLAKYPRTWTWAGWTWDVHEMQGLFWTVPLQSNLRPEQSRPGKHMPLWAGAKPVWSIHCVERALPTHVSRICL